jgi:hypothetical protein
MPKELPCASAGRQRNRCEYGGNLSAFLRRAKAAEAIESSYVTDMRGVAVSVETFGLKEQEPLIFLGFLPKSRAKNPHFVKSEPKLKR